MIKVFISHQAADAALALDVATKLRIRHGIASYLDVIDPYIGKPGEDLALHIQVEMGKCTQLLAVISPSTRASQWVPWEIGVATEKEFPLATFSGGQVPPPEFLRKWPYLTTDADIDRYARASLQAEASFAQKRTTLTEGVARVRSTREFYFNLRSSLGQ